MRIIRQALDYIVYIGIEDWSFGAGLPFKKNSERRPNQLTHGLVSVLGEFAKFLQLACFEKDAGSCFFCHFFFSVTLC